MKLGETASIDYSFQVRKSKLGILHAGDVFVYRSKLWEVVNPVQGGGKLIRTLAGVDNSPMVKPSKTLVQHIIKSKKQKNIQKF